MSRRVAELSPGDVFAFVGVVGTFRVVRISALSATVRRARRKRREYDALDRKTLEVKHVAYDVDEDAFTVSRGALVVAEAEAEKNQESLPEHDVYSRASRFDTR